MSTLLMLVLALLGILALDLVLDAAEWVQDRRAERHPHDPYEDNPTD